MIFLKSPVLYYVIIFAVNVLIGQVFFSGNGLAASLVIAALTTVVVFVIVESFFAFIWDADDHSQKRAP